MRSQPWYVHAKSRFQIVSCSLSLAARLEVRRAYISIEVALQLLVGDECAVGLVKHGKKLIARDLEEVVDV